MDFDEAQKWLNGLPEPTTWDLDRMRTMTKGSALQIQKMKVIQVAGTNGKGSTCAFLESILRHAGIKTGLYTSPHLLDVRERIQINGKIVSKKEFAALASWAQPFVEKHQASYFESLTFMAFKHFLDQHVDWAVVEVGLGGRLDATSVLKPKVAIITNIALEHTTQLGNTIEKIAFEKAGIIPEKGMVITAAKGKALSVIRKKIREKNAHLFSVKPFPIITHYPLKVRMGEAILSIALQGIHQSQNAALAVAAIHELQIKGVIIKEQSIKKGLKNAVWPCRMQSVGNIIIDGAHNPDGIKTLFRALPDLNQKKPWNLVFGVLADKDYIEMVRILSKQHFDSVQLVTPNSNRALSAEKLQTIFQKMKIKTSISENVQTALKTVKNKPVVVCGSLYLAAEVLRISKD